MSETQPARSNFVHLHVHSMYSLYDALGNPEEIVARAKELGYDALALTDHENLYGAIEFYEAAIKRGIKPILGVEVAVAPHLHTDKRAGIDHKVSHLTLLAETNEGYQNLLKLVSISYLDGFYYTARVDKQLLRQYAKGLIALSGCMKGDLPRTCLANDFERAEMLLKEFQSVFGAENFFLELVHHPESPSQISINHNLLLLAERTRAPFVATKDAHYLRTEDQEAQDVLLCIHDGKQLDDHHRTSMAFQNMSLSSSDEMIQAFKDTPSAIERTREIADRCKVSIKLKTNLLPTFRVETNETPEEVLHRLCKQGLDKRYSDPEQKRLAKEQMEFELATIERMGFVPYFLIVQDYIVWAKTHGVIVGPGRGSAAGSVVAYLTEITDLDPLRYGLLFERFLNPDRVSMPDIDTDFDDICRKDVIEYVCQRYGADHVAGIITFGTMAARAAVRDVGRVLGFPYGEIDRLAKMIPPPVQGKHIPLAKSIVEYPELKQIYEQDPRIKRLMDLAIKLEGTARHASQHACAIVIAPEALHVYAPLQKAQGGDVDQVIQYSMHSAESIGLIKMDFLGLSNLSIIRHCLEQVKDVYGQELFVQQIPLDDTKTFELLGKGETIGVFQLESDGMKKYIRELRPSMIEDIIAMVALYRPGPMQFIDSFIARKHGREKITYMHPLMKNALKNTYGLPIYQEQVMQVAKDLAGFTGGEADTLRKAMGKKMAKLMAEMKMKFIIGAVKNGVDERTAQNIFTQFEEFAAYGFNKSHAACYALIAYETAYLKAHFPDAFMAALLNSDCQNLDRITVEIEECRRMGIEVLPPDINESFTWFTVLHNRHALRFGLLAIKGLGEDAVESIILERRKKGPFRDLSDFASRVTSKAFNRRSLESLIKSGALDRFGERNMLYFNIEMILAYHKRTAYETTSGQTNLFAITSAITEPIHLHPSPPLLPRDRLKWEKELLGLYVSYHPFKEYANRLQSWLTPLNQLAEYKKEKFVRIGGTITSAHRILTKNQEPMAFLKLEDTRGEIEVIAFPRVLREKPEIWQEEQSMVIFGRVQEKDGELKFLAENGYELTPDNIDSVVQTQLNVAEPTDRTELKTQPKIKQAVTLYLRAQTPESMLIVLRHMLDQHPGQYHVYFTVDHTGGRQKILSSYRIAFDELIAKELEQILGPDTVRVEV